MKTFRNGIDKYLPGATAKDVYDAVCAFSTSINIQNDAFVLQMAVERGEKTIADMLDNDDIAMAFWKQYAEDNRGVVAFDLRDVLIDSLPKIAIGDLSDIMEGRVGLPYSLGAGHGVDYSRYPDGTPNNTNLAGDAFAEMFSAEISNDQSLEIIKELLPESYSVFKEMLEVLF